MFNKLIGRSHQRLSSAGEESRRFDDSMFDRFTEYSLRLVISAEEESRLLNRTYIDSEHLFLALLQGGESVAAQVLAAFSLTPHKVREQIDIMDGYGEEESEDGELPLTADLKRILKLARRDSLRLGHGYVNPEHLLLGVLRDHKSNAARIMSLLNVDRDEMRWEILREIGIEQDGRSGSRHELNRPHRIGDREAGRRYALLRGKIERLHITTRFGRKDSKRDFDQSIHLDLDYAYYTSPGPEGLSVVDHGALMESVAGVVEGTRFRIPEEVVQSVGEYVLEKFPEVEQVIVTLSGVKVAEDRATPRVSIQGIFAR